MTTTNPHRALDGIGPVEVTVADHGAGQPFLLLHGGGGPAVGDRLRRTARRHPPARVIVPIHPGFGGTAAARGLSSIAGLAALYVALLDQLDLQDVTVIGNSIGGWIAAEMALLESPRVSGIVLVDAVGIEVPGPPGRRLLLPHHGPGRSSSASTTPTRSGSTPPTLPPAAQAIAAGNRAALAVYAGTAMADPTLARAPLGRSRSPRCVLWGDSDRIVDPDYGRAYAAAIPTARFQLLPDTGHFPQLETPDQVIHAIWDSADTGFPASAR